MRVFFLLVLLKVFSPTGLTLKPGSCFYILIIHQRVSIFRSKDIIQNVSDVLIFNLVLIESKQLNLKQVHYHSLQELTHLSGIEI